MLKDISPVIGLSVDDAPAFAKSDVGNNLTTSEHSPHPAPLSSTSAHKTRYTPKSFKLEGAILAQNFPNNSLHCIVAMASKRAIRLFGAGANASVIGRQTSRMSFNATQAFSLALRKQHTCALQSRVSILGNTSTLQVAPVQKRWHSQKPANLNKVYQFDDVSRLYAISLVSKDPSQLCQGPAHSRTPLRLSSSHRCARTP
jgi:hypothetical protein